MLNTIQLITGLSFGDSREVTKCLKGAAAESDVLHVETIYLGVYLFKYQYIKSLMLAGDVLHARGGTKRRIGVMGWVRKDTI